MFWRHYTLIILLLFNETIKKRLTMSKIDKKLLYSIDSLKLRIPLEHLKGYDASLNENLTVSNSDGVIEEEFKRKSKKYHLKNFSIHASINDVKVNSNTFKPSLVILLNSKILGSRYFEGLNLNTIEIAYNTIIDIGILDCSFDTFLKHSFASDIDIKKDYHLEKDEYKELILATKLMTKESSQGAKGYQSFDMGIQWSQRETKSYKTNPFIKIYHKETELYTNSSEFTFKNLKEHEEHIKNLFRIETTIKNRAHLRTLDLNLDTFNLNEILSISQSNLKKVISKAVNCHLLPRTKAMTFKTKKKMTPTNLIYLKTLVVFTTELNWSIDRSINILIRDIENKASKSLNKATLKRLYKDHINGTDYDFKSTKVESILDSFGWF